MKKAFNQFSQFEHTYSFFFLSLSEFIIRKCGVDVPVALYERTEQTAVSYTIRMETGFRRVFEQK
jgi:hypothetical protein